MLQVGKLYSCFEYFLLLFPDKETAGSPPRFAVDRPEPAAVEAFHWTRKLGKPVYYTEKKVPLLVLSVKEKYIEVLAGDRKGWIIVEDWLGIKEIDYA